MHPYEPFPKKESSVTMFTEGQSRFPLYIFDLDGTLALIDHRRHFVEGHVVCEGCGGDTFDAAIKADSGNLRKCSSCNGLGKKKRKITSEDWQKFYNACEGDQPNWPVVGTFLQLYSIACDIRIWSGREDSVRGKTLLWLHQFTKIPLIKLEQILLMRPTGDTTEDHVLKRKWLNALSPNERSRLCAVFDDRNKVVDMWRGEKVACFQVARGDF